MDLPRLADRGPLTALGRNTSRTRSVDDWTRLTKAELVAAMATSHESFGPVQSSTLRAASCFPRQVRLVYHTQYLRNDATEIFVWQLVGLTEGRRRREERSTSTCSPRIYPTYLHLSTCEISETNRPLLSPMSVVTIRALG